MWQEGETLPELLEEEKGEGSISMKLYFRFFRAGGNMLLLLAIIAIFVLGEVRLREPRAAAVIN